MLAHDQNSDRVSFFESKDIVQQLALESIQNVQNHVVPGTASLVTNPGVIPWAQNQKKLGHLNVTWPGVKTQNRGLNKDGKRRLGHAIVDNS